MVCGPTIGGTGSKSAEKTGGDAFSFAADGGMSQGFRTLAMMWATPWRAAFIVADEAMREGLGRNK